MSRGSFRWPPAACCLPISRAFPRPAPSRRNMAMRSTLGRNCLRSVRPTSQRDRTRLSGRGRIIAIGRQRQGWGTYAAGIGFRLGHARALSAFSDRPVRKSAKGSAGGGGVDRRVWAHGFSGVVPHVASEPAGLLRGCDRAGGGAAAGNPSRHPARRSGLDIVAARSGVAAACGVPWSRSRHEPLFRPGPPSRERAVARRGRLSSRSVADLRQCRRCSGSGPEPSSRNWFAIRLVVCDLSAAPYLDLAGSRMLHDLHAELASRGIVLRIVGAHGSGAIYCGRRVSTKKSVISIAPRRSTIWRAATAGISGPSKNSGQGN